MNVCNIDRMQSHPLLPHYRDTMLQALRGCIAGAGPKMSDKVRKEVVGSLEGYLSAPEDGTRTTAAACLGTLCSHVGDDDLALLLNLQLLGKVDDWLEN